MGRIMRILVLFDMPTLTLEDRRAYRRLHKELLNLGFLMEQESFYSKLSLNAGETLTLVRGIEKIGLDRGTVQLLSVTERQYNNMLYLVGGAETDVINSTDRLVIL